MLFYYKIYILLFKQNTSLNWLKKYNGGVIFFYFVDDFAKNNMINFIIIKINKVKSLFPVFFVKIYVQKKHLIFNKNLNFIKEIEFFGI